MSASRFDRALNPAERCEYRQLDTQQYKPALALIDSLLTELKRLDDKMVLTEVHLLESRVYRGIGNLAKSKVSDDRVIPGPARVKCNCCRLL